MKGKLYYLIIIFVKLFLLDSGFRRDSEEQIQFTEIKTKKGYTLHNDSETDFKELSIESANSSLQTNKNLEIIENDVINPLSPEIITNTQTKDNETNKQNNLYSPSKYSITNLSF